MPKEQNFTNFERDMGRRTPNPSRGTPWVGTEIDESGESTGAYEGTGSSLPQDIGADGFEVEPPLDEERDDLSDLNAREQDIAPDEEFDVADLNMTPGVDGFETQLMSVHEHRPSRVDEVDEDETDIDKRIVGEMSESAELTELPIGSSNITAGERGRYECPNCGFEYDVVVGTNARCPACNYEADLASIIGDEAFHQSADSTFLDE